MKKLYQTLTYCKSEYDSLKEENGIVNKIIHLIKNIIDSYRHIPYSYKHNKAYKQVEKYLLYPNGAWHRLHDWDKILMYGLVPWLGVRCINLIHTYIQKHHPTYWTYDGKEWNKHYKDIDEVDWFQAIIDWECARFTKPDKPLDAYDTFLKYYNIDKYKNTILNVLKGCGLVDDDLNKTDIMKNFILK